MTISLIINKANQWNMKKIMSKTTVKQENFMKNLQYYIKKYPIIIKIWVDTEWLPYITINLHITMAQMPALIPKEVEIQRLKKIWMIIIAMGSTAASVEVDNFVDGSLHQTSIRDSAFTPAHWWLYSHFVALPLGWASVAIYDRKVPILRGPNNSMNTGLKMTILGYLATMFTIGINEMWHFWFVEEIFAVPNHWMFNMGVVVAFMGALAYVVRVYARLVELGAETPGENPYIAEMYKMALEGKLYSRSIP